MPELPEVETVRRVFDRVLAGKKIVEAEIAEDSIVLKKTPSTVVRDAIVGRTVTGTGRIGKYFWLELDTKPWIFGHLGMAGWVREIGASTIRLREHGQAPMDDAEGRPKFLKMLLTAEDGSQVVMTDGRRLARIWLCSSPTDDPAIAKLGPDCYSALPSPAKILESVSHRSAPIKALLLDQSLFCGVGNWIADEVLFMAGIRPSRLGRELTLDDCDRLHNALEIVISHAVEVGADKEQFPSSWLFHYRWGGAKATNSLTASKFSASR